MKGINRPHLKFEEIKALSVKNKDKSIVSCNSYANNLDDFTSGFLEAMNFLQYVGCHFSIAVAHELWPPKSAYDKDKAYDVSDRGTKILKYNYFWSKYANIVRCNNEIRGEKCNNEIREVDSPYKFYNSLDYNNRMVLYRWYKSNVDKNNKTETDNDNSNNITFNNIIDVDGIKEGEFDTA